VGKGTRGAITSVTRMKRLFLSFVLAPLFSCVVSADGTTDTTDLPAEEPVRATAEATPSPAPAPIAPNLAPVATDAVLVPVDTRVDAILPRGAFADLHALCNAQTTLAKPYLAKVQTERAERGENEPIVPSCKEDDAVTKDLKVSVDGAIRGATAITVEAGHSIDTFVVVRTAEGWSAVRQPLLVGHKDDPGCGSITRENAIVEVRTEHDALVVVSTADRAYDAENELPGELVMTHARVCHAGGGCTAPVTIQAVVERWNDGKETKTPLFSTSYHVENGGIAHAKSFDDAI
jgi:hypothetical protein